MPVILPTVPNMNYANMIEEKNLKVSCQTLGVTSYLFNRQC